MKLWLQNHDLEKDFPKDIEVSPYFLDLNGTRFERFFGGFLEGGSGDNVSFPSSQRIIDVSTWGYMDLDNDHFINHDEFEAAFEGTSILGCQAFNSECLPFRDGWGCVGLPKHDKKVQRLSLGCLNHEFNMPWNGFGNKRKRWTPMVFVVVKSMEVFKCAIRRSPWSPQIYMSKRNLRHGAHVLC